MKKIMVLLLFLTLSLAQYNNERVTEQNYENSELFFNSYYLNTHPLISLKDLAPGIINDPYLNVYLNPGILPELGNKDFNVYFDFRGDNNRSPLLAVPVYPHDYLSRSYMPPVDNRWNSVSRDEPQPFISFGFFSNLVKSGNHKLILGGTYQFVSKNEPYYNLPFWIYNYSVYADSRGTANEALKNVNIVDRYNGSDEMTNSAHMFSLYAGYEINTSLSVGFLLSGLIHSRSGNYLNENNDDYGNIDSYKYTNKMDREKIQDYDHFEYNLGLLYKVSESLNVGIKGGYLKGNSEQFYNSGDLYLYEYNNLQSSSNWSRSNSSSFTIQNWSQEGNTKHLTFNMEKILNDDKQLTAYYRYTDSDIDTRNNSVILDSSFYIGEWKSNEYFSSYKSNSKMHDIRVGNGKRDRKKHEAMFNFKWTLNENIGVSTGFYLSGENTEVFSNEPVNYYNRYYYYNNYTTAKYESAGSLLEEKEIFWNYSASVFKVKIPVLFEFNIYEKFVLMIGVNRILNNWEIKESSIAYYKNRERTENGILKKESNFAERYTQPSKKITDGDTDIMVGANVNISEDFKLKLLVDPEFSGSSYIRQWMLSFNANL